VASESTASGKVPGTDLREGVPTLPVLYLRRTSSGDPADQRLIALIDGDLTDDARHAEALALLRVHPAMRAARDDLRRVATDARSVLSPLPDSPTRAALESLCDSVVTRTN
jgi:heptaprenyl diphosphate synthase